MFYSRKLNQETGQVEVWECEWSDPGTGMAKKNFIRKYCNEGEQEDSPEQYSTASAICWAPGRTIGNIAVNSEGVFGSFTAKSGDNAVLPCNIVPCGKFRNGADRWYCKTHQIHWGIKADIAAVPPTGEVTCSNHLMGMSYVVDPLVVDFNDFEEIGVWCSLPPALSSDKIVPRAPKIHVHKRFSGDNKKLLDRDFDAIVCSYNQNLGLFSSSEITQIQITPPAAFEFVKSLENDREMACVTCKKCGYPHLDLGSFANTPHAKHFCGNCGNDSVWSEGKIVSTPLKPLHDQFNNSNKYIVPERTLNMDEYTGLKFEVWSSTPAVLWTADRPQELGIHVHIYEKGRRLVDDTFGKVIYQGQELDRKILWQEMAKNTIY
ncbi:MULTISPECIES: hypothetical protein [unclassified Pseudomonas]|uniref:hypothetical protein n=1 Tax=unclassified Pseudomonas TaxID=196821 RepID=UPI0009DD8E8F|nr:MULTISPECIES: hypothetical protein [unclassified Pseudomonas]MBO9551738.1 hypothetical protein [Pseudomonas sp.]RAS23618.1 hypothetical protein H040_03909 [Pseudomonas sp. URMO17WK12:I7]SMF43792.1 hypothetical protein SAMN02745903_03519 [Pseudomonas sp. URMO17WK12:I5]